MAKKIDVNGLDHYHDKVSAMVADEYSSSATYAVGDYCFHAGTLYKCTMAITTAEAWTSGHWTAAKLAEDVTSQSEQIGFHSNIISTNLMGVDVQENLYPGAADWSGTWLNSDSVHMGVSDVTFEGYQTVYSSESWRRYCKNIPVVAGKTYTFECWLKHLTAGAAYIYLKYSSFTVDSATVSQESKQFNGTPANTWVKLSLTFSCTVSGNITPFALSGTSAFYIAKYNLVEGDSVFGLTDALDKKASTEYVSGLGDYKKYYFTLGTSTGSYWNNIISKSVAVGEKVKLVFGSYSGSYLGYVRVDGQKSDDSWTGGLCKINAPIARGASAEFTATEAYKALRIQISRTTDESNVNATVYITTDSELGVSYELFHQRVQNVFHIKKDGTGDFTSFVEGINAACQHMDSIVYVGAGIFDLLDELGSAYIKSASSTQKGVVLKNRVHVICSSQTVLQAHNTQSLYDTEAQYLAAKEYLSPINTGAYGCILENATIDDENMRYSIHDDQGWSGDTPYTNKFINCTLIHKNGMYGDCIGGGLGENCEIEIRGCYLEGNNDVVRLAYYHGNNHTGVTDAKGNIVVCDNYFSGVGTFQVHKYGDSTEMTTAYVSNNSFGTAPSVTTGQDAQDNMQIVEWNNEIRS